MAPLPELTRDSSATGDALTRNTNSEAENFAESAVDVDLELEGGIDKMDMRDHDEMIKSTLTVMENHNAAPKKLFGFKFENRKFAITDEVRFFSWILAIVIFVIVFIFFVVVLAHPDYLEYTDVTYHRTALIIAGVFTIAASCITAFQVYQHYQHWTHAPSQVLVVRVLIMIPVYAISAWLSLAFLPYSTYIDFVRQCYEAFVLYSFLVLLTVYLGGHDGVVEWMHYKKPLVWPPPMCCFTPCTPGSNFLWWLKYTCLQYAVITPIAMFIACVCNSVGDYGDGEFSFSSAYAYVTFVINCSQLASLYALAWLYLVMKEELMPFKPVMKFLVIKSVVFFTWWQGVGFAILVQASVIKESDDFSVGEVQVGLQDFIVCIEMFIFAVIHKYTFGYETYDDGSLAILMEQRATYIATHQYKRAVESARKELKAREEAGQNGQNGHEVEMTDRETVDKEQIESEAKEMIEARAHAILKSNQSESAALFDDGRVKEDLPPTLSPSQREEPPSSFMVADDVGIVERKSVNRSISRSHSDQRLEDGVSLNAPHDEGLIDHEHDATRENL